MQGENLLLTASSSKSKEEGKKKEIKGKEGERQHDVKGLDREKGVEKLFLSAPSKPSRRQAAAVAMFLCLTFLRFTFFTEPPVFEDNYFQNQREENKNCTAIFNKPKWAAGRPFSPLEDVANLAWLEDS